jgi:hypothetical protein
MRNKQFKVQTAKCKAGAKRFTEAADDNLVEERTRSKEHGSEPGRIAKRE